LKNRLLCPISSIPFDSFLIKHGIKYATNYLSRTFPEKITINLAVTSRGTCVLINFQGRRFA